MLSAAYSWAKIISHLEGQLSPIAVSALLDDAEVIELSDDKIIIYTPSDFRQEAIRRTWKQHIEAAARELFQLKLELIVWGDYELGKFRSQKHSQPAWIYNPQLCFDNFIIGMSNAIPLKAARFVAEHPGDEVYNPLYIYDRQELGKLICCMRLRTVFHKAGRI